MKKKNITKSNRRRKTNRIDIGLKPQEITTPRFMQVNDIKGIPTNPGVPKKSILS